MYLAPKGVLDADAIDQLRSGEDGSIIEVDEQFAGNLANVVVPIRHGPVSSNIYNSMNLAEGDFDRATTISPAALGQVTKATASEIMAVEGHTQSEFGRHAEQRDMFLTRIVRRALAAYVASLYDLGDSEGGEENLDDTGRELDQDELEIKREEEGLEEKEESIEELQEENEDLDEQDNSIMELADRIEPEREEKEERRYVQKLVLLDFNGEQIEISPEDIDSDFDIGFSEAGRSPVAQAEMRNNMLALSDKLLQLLQVSQQSQGAVSILAEEMYKTIHEQFEFPINLSFDYLQTKLDEAEPGEKQAQPQQPQGEAPTAAEIVAQIEQLPVDQQIKAIEEALGDEPQVKELLERAKQLPPEEQAQAVAMLLDAIKGAQ
jgi:hypothetical protein